MTVTASAPVASIDREKLFSMYERMVADPHLRGRGRQELRRRLSPDSCTSMPARKRSRSASALTSPIATTSPAPTAATATASPRASISPAWSPS